MSVLIPTHQRAKLLGRVLDSLVRQLVPAGLKWHLGFEPQALRYQYALLEGAKMPNLSPSNPRMRLAVEAFNRLPLGVTKLAGDTCPEVSGTERAVIALRPPKGTESSDLVGWR